METNQAPVQVIKLTVALPIDAMQAVEDMAARNGTTKTQTLREAVALKAFLDTYRRNGRILVERDGVQREVVFGFHNETTGV